MVPLACRVLLLQEEQLLLVLRGGRDAASERPLAAVAVAVAITAAAIVIMTTITIANTTTTATTATATTASARSGSPAASAVARPLLEELRFERRPPVKEHALCCRLARLLKGQGRVGTVRPVLRTTRWRGEELVCCCCCCCFP